LKQTQKNSVWEDLDFEGLKTLLGLFRVFLLRARLGDGSVAPSPVGLTLDGSPVPLGSTATHEPAGITRSLWARWKSLEATPNNPKLHGMTL